MANEPAKQYINSINGYTIQDQELTDTVEILKTTVSTIKDWTNEKIAALTKDDIGLDKVDNTADADKSVKVAVQDIDGDKFTEKYFKFRGNITDFNNAYIEGAYEYAGICSNGYKNTEIYGNLIVYNNKYNAESGSSSTYIEQIAFDTINNIIYTRQRISSKSWTTWKTIAYTSDISTATDSKAGIMKLYTSIGSSTDGTMTRKAITDSLNDKAKSDHTHTATSINFTGGSSAGSVPAIYESITGSIKNIFRYLPSEAIYVEYSKDGGTTWTEYLSSYDDIRKNDLTNHNGVTSYAISGPDTITTLTTNYKLRFTFSPTDGRYGNIKFFYIYITTGGHSLTCDLERSTVGAKTTFIKARTGIRVDGWSGPNIIDMTGAVSTFGGGSSQTTNGYSVRLTFNITAVNANYTNNHPMIQNIRAYADPIWGTAGIKYLETGLDYSINNMSKEITFPAEITATKLNGCSTEANALADASGKYNCGEDTHPVYFKNGIPVLTKYTLGASVPAAPTAGANTKFLRGDGTWQTIDTNNMLKYSAQTLTDADKTQVLTNLGINIATDSDVNSMITDTLNATNLKVPASTIVMNSATPDSTKQFEFTVDDTGTLTAHEV